MLCGATTRRRVSAAMKCTKLKTRGSIRIALPHKFCIQHADDGRKFCGTDSVAAFGPMSIVFQILSVACVAAQPPTVADRQGGKRSNVAHTSSHDMSVCWRTTCKCVLRMWQQPINVRHAGPGGGGNLSLRDQAIRWWGPRTAMCPVSLIISL